MKRPATLSITEAFTILWAVIMAFVILILVGSGSSEGVAEATPHIETVYVEVPGEPVVVYIEKEPEPDTCVPYYAEIANSITAEEIDLLAKVTYLEAGNQSLIGQRAVVEVVLNRVMDDKFPDTIMEVLYQPGQFTTAPRLAAADPTEEQYRAVELTLGTSTPILEPYVLFFLPKEFLIGKQSMKKLAPTILEQ